MADEAGKDLDHAPPGRRPRSWAAPLVVGASALVAAASRIPATAAPLRPDESGYTLVARAWAPGPYSPYGPYWVDRPPMLVAVFRLADQVPGGHGIRWFGVVAALLVVLAAAGAASEVVAHLGTGAHRRTTGFVVGATAVVAAALVANPRIDLLLAKGELLALPLLMGSTWLSLRAFRTRSVPVAALAGLLAGAAPGLKQNLVGAIAFGLVLLAAERLRGRLDPRTATVLGGAFLAGVSVQVLATGAWALLAGVHPGELYDAVVGVRAQAVGVIAGGPLGTVARRALTLVTAFVVTGLALLLVGLLGHVVRRGRASSSLAWAALLMAVIDGTGLVLGGFFRLPYLFAMVPSAVLGLALLLATRPSGAPRRRVGLAELLVAAVVGSFLVSAVGWLRDLPSVDRQPVAVMLGRSIGAVSRPGDSLTAVFGNADLQYQSGLPSPYEYLWSLPARARDPDLAELDAVLRGPRAPTWVVTVYDIGAVQGRAVGRRLDAALAVRYEHVGGACGGRDVYRRVDRPRPRPVLGCRALHQHFGAEVSAAGR